MWHCTVAVLGFSLPSQPARPDPSPAPFWRRLEVINEEPCKGSCDSGNAEQCDGQDEELKWKRSCDLRPVTSCDRLCVYPPPPALPPWLENGTWPAPPPSSPPTEDENFLFFGASIALLVFALLLFGCFCVFSRFEAEPEGTPCRVWIGYWCCCCVPFNDWEENRRRAANQKRIVVVQGEPLESERLNTTPNLAGLSQ